jgi:hypothetical protein
VVIHQGNSDSVPLECSPNPVPKAPVSLRARVLHRQSWHTIASELRRMSCGSAILTFVVHIQLVGGPVNFFEQPYKEKNHDNISKWHPGLSKLSS